MVMVLGIGLHEVEWQLWPGEWYLDVTALLFAVVLDLAIQELPDSVHPVVWMGRLTTWLEDIGPSTGSKWPALLWGMVIAAVVPSTVAMLVWTLANVLRELSSILYVAGCALLLSTTFAVRGLASAAEGVQEAMESKSIGEARYELSNLVSRDTRALSRPLVAAGAIESVAENTTDSFIGPWLAFALLGLPGAFIYRAINTLDSMIGYRGKYEHLGKASALLDDFVNLIPARLSAAFILSTGALKGLSARSALAWTWRGRRLTASPNAGWTIGAMSGRLGVALEKPEHYRIGDGMPDPSASHITAAIRVAYAVGTLGILVTIGALALRGALSV